MTIFVSNTENLATIHLCKLKSIARRESIRIRCECCDVLSHILPWHHPILCDQNFILWSLHSWVKGCWVQAYFQIIANLSTGNLPFNLISNWVKWHYIHSLYELRAEFSQSNILWRTHKVRTSHFRLIMSEYFFCYVEESKLFLFYLTFRSLLQLTSWCQFKPSGTGFRSSHWGFYLQWPATWTQWQKFRKDQKISPRQLGKPSKKRQKKLNFFNLGLTPPITRFLN